MELKPCPFCGKADRLSIQFRQAKGTRRGRHDSAIYCTRCYSYGPRVRSEDLALPECDIRNETVTIKFRDRMSDAAIKAWNGRMPSGWEDKPRWI